MTLLVKKPVKERKNKVNEIEDIYIEEGLHSEKFTKQLIDFIGFVLNRYSNETSFPDDMVHFTYLRIMERLGASLPESPENGNEDELLAWKVVGKKCLFDASRSNLGNYIFSIARNAYSNYMYHSSKKFKELDPPSTEIPEPEISYSFAGKTPSKALYITDPNSEYLTESIRRYLLWKQNN